MLADRRKIRHFYRRFGFGISDWEATKLTGKSMEEIVGAALDQPADAEPAVSPWRYFSVKDEGLNSTTRNLAYWWELQMATTQNPIPERLAVFWHDHFGIGGDKVGASYMSLPYLNDLRTKGSGKFSDLLTSVVKGPAMIMFLDGQQNVKGRPNENFAREVMELFTLGVDNGYTEEDIAEAAKAFTGWRYRYHLTGKTNPERVKEIRGMALEDKPVITFLFSPGQHEKGVKKVLGKEVEFGQQVVDLLAAEEQTARYVTTKLWKHYAYPEPSDAVIERFIGVWKKTDGSIKDVLKAIALSDEFYSEKSVRKMIKSPVDISMGLVRAFNTPDVFKPALNNDPGILEPIPWNLRGFSQDLHNSMQRMGMDILHPPSVEGWHWDQAWISTDSILARSRMPQVVFQRRSHGPYILNSGISSLMDTDDVTAEQFLDRLLDRLDIELPKETRSTLAAQITKDGGTGRFKNKNSGFQALIRLMRFIYATPEAQLY
jgi:uncharacterized protein (DUF1800 family)